MRGRDVRGRGGGRNITQNNNGNSQVRRSSDWCRKSFILIPAAQADLVWSALVEYILAPLNRNKKRPYGI